MCLPMVASAQIDPAKRDLVQFGYNQPVEGRAPLAGYMYYYHNQPDFLRTNLTLRLALAPTYLDSELGLGHALGPNTDLGLGLAGGGFADSYNEIRGGKWIERESFDGYGAELSANIYHLFNPGQLDQPQFRAQGQGPAFALAQGGKPRRSGRRVVAAVVPAADDLTPGIRPPLHLRRRPRSARPAETFDLLSWQLFMLAFCR